jgi:hypothetical protein
MADRFSEGYARPMVYSPMNIITVTVTRTAAFKTSSGNLLRMCNINNNIIIINRSVPLRNQMWSITKFRAAKTVIYI